ncbi:MAG: hypothetical protein HY078_02055 [Elusimicrobia bacterium]|nr:hypothetical protein [Elusimicrobiota bacterium]
MASPASWVRAALPTSFHGRSFLFGAAVAMAAAGVSGLRLSAAPSRGYQTSRPLFPPRESARRATATQTNNHSSSALTRRSESPAPHYPTTASDERRQGPAEAQNIRNMNDTRTGSTGGAPVIGGGGPGNIRAAAQDQGTGRLPEDTVTNTIETPGVPEVGNGVPADQVRPRTR